MCLLFQFIVTKLCIKIDNDDYDNDDNDDYDDDNG